MAVCCVPYISRLMVSALLQVHVAWLKSGTAMLAFRGTATMQDSLQDVKFLRRNIDYMQELYPGTKAHVGTFMMDPSFIVRNRLNMSNTGSSKDWCWLSF